MSSENKVIQFTRPLSHFPKVRIVLLDQPVEVWDQPLVKDLFHKMIGLKLKGYWREYSSNVLAIDKTDFFGTHLLACSENPVTGELTPLMGYRSVSLARSEKYSVEFPALTVAAQSKDPTPLNAVRKIIEESKRKKVDLSYDSSWTIDSEAQKIEHLPQFLRHFTTLLGVKYHAETIVREWITFGVCKFKTNKYFGWMGLKKIFAPFGNPWLDGADIEMYHHESEYSPEALAISEQFAEHWRDRIVIAPEGSELKVAYDAERAALAQTGLKKAA